MSKPKRNVPPIISRILEKDEVVTKRFVTWANNITFMRSLRKQYKMLEVSCHGVPWFAFWIAFTWLFPKESLVTLQINILLGLLIDIIFVAVIKAYTRRRRPAANKKDAFVEVGPDKFSFPSGHASRATFVALFFAFLYEAPIFMVPPLFAWSACVCLSRVLMCRHHLLDVAAGIALGFLVTSIMSVLWLNESTAQWLMSFLSDEKLDGGEYHV